MLRHCLFIICLLTTYSISGQNKVNFLSDGSNTLSLRVTAYGKKAKEAIENAEQAAVRTILFRGIPGSNQVENPLIGVNEEKIQKEHKAYFKELFEEKRCSSFILSTVPVSKFSKDATKKKCIVADIKVNLQALRSDLEQHKVIRKFGF
ncbi:hypothetical protein [uncultured Bacteroides sp.]|jgi:hypothetical protein|uniref:hypothetical protein n=1 Tax=uncultured Bacteroides sp. TaxID=162156 RepID=UPI00280B92C9|nr:hypothetical protein [uncultured Bacteroides sp.]